MMTSFVTNDFMYTINLFVRSSHNQDFIFKLYVAKLRAQVKLKAHSQLHKTTILDA